MVSNTRPSDSTLNRYAKVQLHVRDNDWGKAQTAKLLRRLSRATPTAATADPDLAPVVTAAAAAAPEPERALAGALVYTCVAGNRLTASNFREVVPGVPVGGGYVMGELGPAGLGGQSYLHSHTSMLGLFWDLPPPPKPEESSPSAAASKKKKKGECLL